MRFVSLVAVPSLLVLAMAGLCWPQSLSTGIHGVIKDPDAMVAPGATVRLVSDMGPALEHTSDAEGNYAFTGLRSGTYHIEVSLLGFKNFSSTDITLIEGQAATLDVTLLLATNQASVDVVGTNLPTVETVDASVSNTITSKELTGLQLNGRNFTQLIALTPGVSNQTGQDEAKVGAQGSAAYSVNGGRVEYNSFNLDGTDLLNVGFNGGINTLIVYPSLDAISEMKVLTSNYSALYGRTASGTVLVHTKAGTSEFHGDAYFFVRNEIFNARNFFDETKGAPLYRRYDFGLTLGGPLYIPNVYNTKKDKTFFFISEEYRNERTPFEFNQGVPSAAERSGNFSDVCPANGGFFYQQAPPGYNIAKTYPDCPGTLTGGIPGAPPGSLKALSYTNSTGQTIYNHILPGTFSQNALAILSTGVIPLPNATSGCNSSIQSCYVRSVSEPTQWREDLARIDHYFSETSHLYVRYIHDEWGTTTPTPQYGIVTNSFPTVQSNFSGPGTSLLVRHNETLSPTLLNDFYVSYANSTIWMTDTNGQNGSTYLSPSALSAPCTLTVANPTGDCPLGSLFGNNSGKLPGLEFITGPAYGGGFSVDPGYLPWHHTNPVYSAGDVVSKVWRDHIFQFGGETVLYYRNQNNSVSGAATGDTQGIFKLTGGVTGAPFAAFLTQTTTVDNLVSPPAVYITQGGGIESYQQDSAQVTYHQRYQIAEPFFQDDWKIAKRLTLNLGVRVSLFGRYHELNDNVYNWEASAYNPALAAQIYVGANDNLFYKNAVNSAGGAVPVTYNPAAPPPYLTNGLVRCGYNGVPTSCMTGHLFNPAPRVGFAWDVFGDGKTALRGGYGIFFEHGTGSEDNTGSLEGSAPLVLSATVTNPRALPCLGGVSPPPCQQGFVPPGQIAAVPLDVTSIQTKTQWPYVQQWSLSLQHQFPTNTLFTVAYVGSKGTHLTAETQINSLDPVPAADNPFSPGEPLLANAPIPASGGYPAVPGDCPVGGVVPGSGQSLLLSNGVTVAPGNPAYNNLELACSEINGKGSGADAFRPYVGIGRIFAIDNDANSNYNSLQVTIKHTTGPFTLGVAYTYSHSLDDASDRNDPIPNAFDLHSNYASSNFDQRHLLSISYIYDLSLIGIATRLADIVSWEKGQPPITISSSALKSALSGWQLSGITVYQSGLPFSVINNPTTGPFIADNAGVGNDLTIGSIQSYPDVIGSRNSALPAGSNSAANIGPLLYNPGIFAPPTGLTFGDAGRNFLNNPARTNFDVSLVKIIRINERHTLQLRAEAFNVFNHTQFEIYNPAKGNQPNNTLTCYGLDSSGQYTAGAPECITGSSFLRPIDAHRARTMQMALKWLF